MQTLKKVTYNSTIYVYICTSSCCLHYMYIAYKIVIQTHDDYELS